MNINNKLKIAMLTMDLNTVALLTIIEAGIVGFVHKNFITSQLKDAISMIEKSGRYYPKDLQIYLA